MALVHEQTTPLAADCMQRQRAARRAVAMLQTLPGGRSQELANGLPESISRDQGGSNALSCFSCHVCIPASHPL
jgi:hypothetical protein